MNIGTIIQWGSNTIPNEWLLCDGSAVSRTTYADLFAVIGTNFGSGDGSTTFNLPDLRGKVGVGKSSEIEFDTLGKTGGEKTHTLTVSEMPSHYHRIYMGTAGTFKSSPRTNIQSTGNITADATYNTYPTGDGQSHNILQPYITTNYIIKALEPNAIKVSELNEATSLNDNDLLMVVQNNENKKIEAGFLNNLIKYEVVSGLDLNSGDTYQLTLPTNTIFVEPLLTSEGSQYSGGQFVIPGLAGYTYCVSNSNINANNYRGVFINISATGLVTISSYYHNGSKVSGFRIWHINL